MSRITYVEHRVPHNGHYLYAREYPGKSPAILLLHGFPDNIHLYDYLIPELNGRHIVAFDFMGWGESDKPEDYPYTADGQTDEIDSVVTHLKLRQVIPVAHDASGPPAIDWSLRHPERVASLVLLNCYYNWMPELRRPKAIAIYSTPLLRNIARFIARRNSKFDAKLYAFQLGEFMRDETTKREMIATLYPAFLKSRKAFWKLNNGLLLTAMNRLKRVPQLRFFERPVRIIFGDKDPYMNVSVAKRFRSYFPNAELFILPDTYHYLQVDEPKKVAELILSA